MSHFVHELSPPSHEHSDDDAPDACGLGLGKERRALLVNRVGFFESSHVIYLYLHLLGTTRELGYTRRYKLVFLGC